MDRIAFILGDTVLYWNSIILTMAAATAICLFLGLYLGRGGSSIAAAAVVPLAMVVSIVLARLVHWYFRPDAYAGIEAAMTDYTTGGYALAGVFAGCFLTAVLTRVLFLHRDLPGMLDAMSVAGCAGIAVGRLACFFSAADRGKVLEGLTELPWVYPVKNVITGAMEYRLATFVLQAIAGGVILVILLIVYFSSSKRRGDTTLMFLLLHGAVQVVMDSTRYDSLYMRSNGFIGIVQILGAVSLVFVCIVFSVRMVRAKGLRGWQFVIWLLIAAGLGGAGYMEYYVQRHGDLMKFSYTVMSICLCVIVLLALICYFCGLRRAEENE